MLVKVTTKIDVTSKDQSVSMMPKNTSERTHLI